MNRKQNINQKINIKSCSLNVTITLKDQTDNQIIQFQIPLGSDLKLLHQILWKNKNQFENKNKKLIGFQSANDDPLLDFSLYKNIGKVKENLVLKPLYKNTKNQGLSKYKLLKCLATGGFSKVYLARSLQNGQFYAAKFVDKIKVPSQDKKMLIMNQKMVNQIADYTFLVKMSQFIETQHFYVFIMDYCPGGQLFFLLRSVKCMTQQQAKIYFVEILLGIQYIHKQGVMYRDLKPQNIMIDQTGHIKIADFGLAKIFKQRSFSFCGSIEYMSPQIVTNAGHSFQVDFYCLGALLFQLLVGCPPFYDPDISENQTKKMIAYAEVQFPSDLELSNEVKDLIQKLLTKNPNHRLGHFGGAKQVMIHPWIGKINRQQVQDRRYNIPFPPDLSKFNFDPQQVGVSQQRFTNKIHDEYKLIKAGGISRRKLKQAKTQNTIEITRQKSLSPYCKNYSLTKKKKSSNRNSTHNSTINLTISSSKTKIIPLQNFKNLIFHGLNKFQPKRSISKNKSPSIGSIDKKNLLKKYFKIAKKYEHVKTQTSEHFHSYSQPQNSLMKKKKMFTQSSQIIKNKDMINKSFVFKDLKMSKQLNRQRQSLHWNSNAFKKSEIGLRYETVGFQQKQSNLLKKTGKIRANKRFKQNETRKGIQY